MNEEKQQVILGNIQQLTQSSVDKTDKLLARSAILDFAFEDILVDVRRGICGEETADKILAIYREATTMDFKDDEVSELRRMLRESQDREKRASELLRECSESWDDIEFDAADWEDKVLAFLEK